MAKEFMLKGKTIEELKQMSIKDFTELIPSRQRRSILRGFTDAQKVLLSKIRATNKGEYKKSIKTHCRDMIILPEMVGLTIHIHRGKDFVPIMIVPEMLGHYLGEFSLTRSKVAHSAPGVGATKSSGAVKVK